MESATHGVFIFHPASATYGRTPFEGDEEEMLEVAEELQEMSLKRGDRALYVVRPLPYPRENKEKDSRESR